jgi:8-oxo-dGTP diphosphatase
MSTAAAAVVRVGVGVLIESPLHRGAVLFGQRKGSHGAGLFALPGGHLELGEAWDACARREAKEETNLDLDNVRFAGVTNSVCMGGDPLKHYVTVFMRAEVAAASAPLENMEPHKCQAWDWVPWADILEKRQRTPEVLFDPMIHFIDSLPNGGRDLF